MLNFHREIVRQRPMEIFLLPYSPIRSMVPLHRSPIWIIQPIVHHQRSRHWPRSHENPHVVIKRRTSAFNRQWPIPVRTYSTICSHRILFAIMKTLLPPLVHYRNRVTVVIHHRRHRESTSIMLRSFLICQEIVSLISRRRRKIVRFTFHNHHLFSMAFFYSIKCWPEPMMTKRRPSPRRHQPIRVDGTMSHRTIRHALVWCDPLCSSVDVLVVVFSVPYLCFVFCIGIVLKNIYYRNCCFLCPSPMFERENRTTWSRNCLDLR